MTSIPALGVSGSHSFPWCDDSVPPLRAGRIGPCPWPPALERRKTDSNLPFYVSLRQLLLPPSRRHQLLKLMAMRWHVMAVAAAVSLRISSNTVKEDNHKLKVSNF